VTVLHAVAASPANALGTPLPQIVIGWPAGHTPVLGNRPLRPGADRAPTRFAGQIWRLDPAHPDAHTDLDPINWTRFPAGLVTAFKTFALAALEHPFPADPLVRAHAERPAVSTIVNWMSYLRAFAVWMHQAGVGRLCDLTGTDLDRYRDHVLATGLATRRKAALLGAVRSLWAYRSRLPADARIGCNPFGGATGNAIAGRPLGRVNKTPRIAPATMEQLLGWALRMVEHIGPDIAAARAGYQQLDDGTHSSQTAFAHLRPRERIEWFAQHARSAGLALPGHSSKDEPAVNYSRLARILGLSRPHGATTWKPAWKRIIEESGLPIAPGSYLGTITGRVDGRPWQDHPITVAELPKLIRALSAAAFVIICYPSGMRVGVVLNLRRGCAGTDQATGELLVRGRPGKGYDRAPAADAGPEGDRPWVVVQPVHTAIALLESVTGHTLLFPAGITKRPRRRLAGQDARTAGCINEDIEVLIAWVNTAFTGPAGAAPIPPDPAKRIHAARFRRTLAYFIVRRPRGLIAAALQYGHLNSKITLGYSGSADTSWLDDLTIERLEMVLEQADQDWTRLQDCEHVSGPAAGEYKTRVAGVARFAGRTVTGARNAGRLLTQTGPGVYHGNAMTCVWRQQTAACRQAALDQGMPAGDGPDETSCRAACLNLACTDRDIDQQRHRLTALRQQHPPRAPPAAPRHRTQTAAACPETTLDTQKATRRTRTAHNTATAPAASDCPPECQTQT